MKKQLHLLSFFIGSLLISGSAYAQINYTEDFDGEEITWPSNEFAVTNELSCDGNSYRANLYTGFIPNNNAETVSESIGTSNGMEVTLTYDYKILQTMNGNAAQNDADWGNFTVYYGESATGPFTILETINTTNHIESADCATRTLTFTPEDGSEIYLKIITNLGAPTPTNHISFYFDNFTAEQESSGPCETLAPDAEAEQTVCTGSTIEDLQAEGDTIIWYSSEDADEPLAEGTVLVDGSLYYAAQIPDGGCESEERTKVTAFLTVVDEPEVEMTTQTICGEAFVDELEAEETVEEGELIWYDAETGGNVLTEETVLEDGETYYVAQFADGCESTRIGVTIEVSITPDPEAVSPQVFTGEAPMAVELYEDVEVTAEGIITWYASEEDAQEGENALANPTTISEPGTYYVTQTVDGCESDYIPVEIQMVLGSEDFSSDKFSYYPNPVESMLTLTYTDAITQIEVINMLGQTVMSSDSNTNMIMVDMSDLADGCYFVKVVAGEKAHSVKVFKK
jgi:hypothetical protein